MENHLKIAKRHIALCLCACLWMALPFQTRAIENNSFVQEEQPQDAYGSGYAVGTPTGSFSVTNLGAATYQLQIEIPDGGSLNPQISLSYNSQLAGYGLAGYGFNLTGFSAITRGKHVNFQHKTQTGVSYTANDTLFLDGKRLILQSGKPGQAGTLYTIEGEPFTKVTEHGDYGNGIATTWFEVITNTGLTYQYGNSANSKIAYRNGKGEQRIASWHINKATDRYSNYITYDYAITNLQIRPIEIKYGMNAVKSRGITNRIRFAYQALGDNARSFTIEDRIAKIDFCLASITTTCNDAIYRKYTFTYDGNSDQTIAKWTRLVKVEEANGKGEKLPPITFNWHHLPAYDMRATRQEDVTHVNNKFVIEGTKNFLSADLNGDGYGDIIRITPVQVKNGTLESKTYVYVSKSNVSPSGSVSYAQPLIYELPPNISFKEISQGYKGTTVMDFDGDGYNDLVFMCQSQQSANYNKAVFYVIGGKHVQEGNPNPSFIFATDLHSNNIPLLVPLDVDGDGKDEFVCMEQNKTDNHFFCSIVKYMGGTETRRSVVQFTHATNRIEKFFAGDYNNDGLSDLILLYAGGYKIYFNNGGGNMETAFSESNTKTGTDFGNNWRVFQGDFNGDGLLDFVFNISRESILRLALNRGDGTFAPGQSDDLGVSDGPSSLDDNSFSISVLDIDHDGRSDVVVSKSQYKKYKIRKTKYLNTQTKWLLSTGSSLKLVNSHVKNRREDADEALIFMGDFDGDGYMELANYGSFLNSADNTFNENINIYKSGFNLSQAGKITSITDGMGNRSQIQYAFATSPEVYRKSLPSEYPVNSYTLPLSVVSNTTVDNGSIGSQETKYAYQDLRIHVAGKGILGFNTISAENTTLGTKETTTITEWDKKHWLPSEQKRTASMGNRTETAVSKHSITPVEGNYFMYVSQRTETDGDGNTQTTTTNYDAQKGVVLDETISSDGDNMYKRKEYKAYTNIGGCWLPKSVHARQKHKDDKDTHLNITMYMYDDKGNITLSLENVGTGLNLNTTSTYDVYGNKLSSVSSGYGVSAVTQHQVYDPSGRLVTKSYTIPASTVNTFTYDIWGNVLTESDATNPSNILTTTHSYDGWGRKISSQQADGTRTTYSIGWGSDARKAYYEKEEKTGQPAVTVWYDKGGHEVLHETRGPNNIAISQATTYNGKGQVVRTESKKGKLLITQTYSYDPQGRVIKEVSSSGKSISYSYGNRSVTAVTAGRSYTRITDAWGNLVKSIDPAGGEVVYAYSSTGKPMRVRTHGAVVAMEYDMAGNRISLTDPNAETSTYSYSADGKLLTQTDGRGVETKNTYDELGRISSVQVGQHTIHYAYGSSGNEAFRLIRQSMGNNSLEFAYDRFGRVITETRNVDGQGALTFSYAYNEKNQLARTRYPGGLDVSYQYDANGFQTQTLLGDKVIAKQTQYDGLVSGTSFMGKLSATRTLNERGYEKNLRIARGTTVLENFDEVYEGTTSNLVSRKRNASPLETFTYDNLDRLISVKSGQNETMKVDYAANGNILFKTGVGNYTYNKYDRPHAVMEVDNADNVISSDALNTPFNDFGKIQCIEDTGQDLRMDFSYGPDQQRWLTSLYKSGNVIRTTLYVGDYEKIIENGVTREFYYLGDNVIVVRQDGNVKPYLAFTDNLGSILSVMDENGSKVFDATYDAWGRQTVTLNSIGLQRGYTGHEMLNEFGIINMNGRLYDPILGRFLSLDNFVQMPDNSQNFNRYSYCLNNPLKYTDPSGEVVWFIPAAIIVGGGILNIVVNIDNIHSFGQALSYFGVGAGAASVAMFGGTAGIYASGGILSGGNSILTQGYNNGFGNINWTNVGCSTSFGVLSSGVSTFVGGSVSSVTGNWFSGISNVTLKRTLEGTFGGAITGAAMGSISGTNAADGSFWENVANGAGMGALTGGLGGFARGRIEQAKINRAKAINGLNPNMAIKSKPIQSHHYVSMLNQKFRAEFQKFEEKYGFNFQKESWNIEELPHQGRHPDEYHFWVLDQLKTIDKLANGNRQMFINNFEIYIKQHVRNNPEMLYKNFWLNNKIYIKNPVRSNPEMLFNNY